MTYSLPHPEPAEALAFDLVRAQLDGDRGTVATLVADASQTPRRLIAVLASTAQIAIELGRHAHGDDLGEWLRHGLAHTLALAPLPEHPSAAAAADLVDPDGAALPTPPRATPNCTWPPTSTTSSPPAWPLPGRRRASATPTSTGSTSPRRSSTRR